MALSIDITRENLVDALEVKIASLKRAHNAQRQKQFKDLYDQQISEYEKAKASIKDAK